MSSLSIPSRRQFSAFQIPELLRDARARLFKRLARDRRSIISGRPQSNILGRAIAPSLRDPKPNVNLLDPVPDSGLAKIPSAAEKQRPLNKR